VLVLFVGVAMITSRLVRPLATLVGWPAQTIGGVAGNLARGNSIRNPGRTASTAAALMIGIALVTFVAVLASGMKASNRGAIEDQVIADYVVTAQDGFSPFVAAAGDAVAQSPDAEVVANVRSDLGKVGDSSTYITGIEPNTILETYRFEWKEGNDSLVSRLGENGAIVDANFAEDNDITMGEQISVLVASGQTLDVEVLGLYEPPPFYPRRRSIPSSSVLATSSRSSTWPEGRRTPRPARSRPPRQSSRTRTCKHERRGSSSRTRTSASS
jgi:putative ABC transport system permease protein